MSPLPRTPGICPFCLSLPPAGDLPLGMGAMTAAGLRGQTMVQGQQVGTQALSPVIIEAGGTEVPGTRWSDLLMVPVLWNGMGSVLFSPSAMAARC